MWRENTYPNTNEQVMDHLGWVSLAWLPAQQTLSTHTNYIYMLADYVHCTFYMHNIIIHSIQESLLYHYIIPKWNFILDTSKPKPAPLPVSNILFKKVDYIMIMLNFYLEFGQHSFNIDPLRN